MRWANGKRSDLQRNPRPCINIARAYILIHTLALPLLVHSPLFDDVSNEHHEAGASPTSPRPTLVALAPALTSWTNNINREQQGAVFQRHRDLKGLWNLP